jgi:ribosome-associated protein
MAGIPELGEIQIDESELVFDFIRASGPGGQNINKVASAVQLRFDLQNSPSLPEEVRVRLKRLAGKRVTEAGILIIEAKQYRTQERNRQAAIERFANLVRKASEPPRPRKPTRPTLASKQKRLETKRRRSEIKRQRSPSPREGEY